MKKEEVISKIAEVIENITGIPTDGIGAETALMDDIELSSLEVMTVVAEVESVFGIRFTTKDLMSIITMDDLAECVMQKLA